MDYQGIKNQQRNITSLLSDEELTQRFQTCGKNGSGDKCFRCQFEDFCEREISPEFSLLSLFDWHHEKQSGNPYYDYDQQTWVDPR